MFETVSFHLTKPCNMLCTYYYATFEDFTVKKQLPLEDALEIVEKLTHAGMEKITFAGGEPMLYRHLPTLIRESKRMGLTTSIITNGSLLGNQFLDSMVGDLDWIGVSIDSLDVETNRKIGRFWKKDMDYMTLVSDITDRGYKLKINTVVNRYNKREFIRGFIEWSGCSRWKVFQALRVEGQNEKQFDQIKCSKEDFDHYCKKNQTEVMVAEDNELMTGSYLLVDPLGRLFENSQGRHTYSSPLQGRTVDECLKEINLDREMFLKRGGVYEW